MEPAENGKSLEKIKQWMPSENTMHVTTDYDRFTWLPYNRNVDHEKRIVDSIKKIGLVPIPIIVNDKMEIIDGQHRFTACKALGLPIYYIVVPFLGIEQCSELNSVSKNWSTKNHVHAYTAPVYKDNDSYIYYELLTLEHPGINPTQMSCILAPLYKVSNRKVRHMIRRGELRISEPDYNHITKKIVWAEELKTAASKLTGNTENFWEAVSYLYEIGTIDKDKLKRRIMSAPASDLSPVGDMKDMLDKIEEIYNKNAKKGRIYMRQQYDMYKNEGRAE